MTCALLNSQQDQPQARMKTNVVQHTKWKAVSVAIMLSGVPRLASL